MREFKEGAFVLAKRLKKPILPIVINGSRTALPKNSFNFHGETHIEVTVLPPVMPESFGEDSAKELAAQVQHRIKQLVVLS
jgi:1-acyl-sn-glycerol-3-phosphate acyltransferase